MNWWTTITALWRGGKGTRFPYSAIMVSLLIHLAIGFTATFVTIAVIYSRPKVMFEAKPQPGIPARKLEHSIRVKQMQKQVRKPQVLQRLATAGPSKIALPEMPRLSTPDVKNLRDTPLLSAKAGSTLGGLGGIGGGAGRGLTGGSGYSDTRFFGENVRTRAICILMDISPSMVAKGVVEDVREETGKMMESLSPVTKFDVVAFVDGSMPFTPQMVFATQDNKQKAMEWLKQRFDGRRQGNLPGFSGSTPYDALKLAVELGSDTIFVLSDDPPYLKEGKASSGIEIKDHQDQILDFVKNVEKTTGRSVKINAIIYKPHENDRGEQGKAFYKKIAQITGGRFTVVK